MLYVEINSEDRAIVEEVLSEYPACEVIEVNSFGAETTVQILIPIVAILAPTVSTVITKLLESHVVSIKYDGIELSGNRKTVSNLIKVIQDIRAKDNRS